MSTPAPSRRVVLVTGASSGIGRATAAAFAARGDTVVGTSRNPDHIPDAARLSGVRYVALDLTDRESVRSLPDRVGRVDVLVNNAGESLCGPFEDVPVTEVDRLFDVNVIGPVLLTQLLLPGMRERGYGRVVMIGSMLASFPVAHRSAYAASKAALKAFTEATRHEITPHGVWLTTVEPGSVATGIDERRSVVVADDSVYADDLATVLAALDRRSRAGVDADAVAALVLRAVDARRPRPLYAVGSSAPLLFTLRRVLPRAAVLAGVNRAHGLRLDPTHRLTTASGAPPRRRPRWRRRAPRRT